MSVVLESSGAELEGKGARRSALLLRLEYPAAEALMCGERCPIRGRLFLPSSVTEPPRVELRVSRLGESHGPLSAGLLLLAERAGMPDTAAVVLDEELTAAGTREQQEYAATYPVPGTWYHFACSLLLPDDSFPLGRYAVFLSCENAEAATVSNPCILRKESVEVAAAHWWPQSEQQSRLRQAEVTAFGGFLLYPLEEICRMAVEVDAEACVEVHWQAAKSAELARFPDRGPGEVTAVGIAADAAATRVRQATLRVELRDGETLRIPLPLPLLAATPALPEHCIERIRLDEEGLLELSGYVLLPLNAALDAGQLELGIATFRGWRRLGTAEVPGSSAELTTRADLEERFAHWTQVPPWGFSVRFCPSTFSGRDGIPVPEVRVKGWDRGLPLATVADVAKIRELTAAREDHSLARRAFEELQQFTAPLRLAAGHNLWVKRETFNSGQPSRLLFAAHNLSATEGAPRVLLELLRFLRAQDAEHALAVLSGSDGPLRAEIESLGVRVHVAEGLHFAPESRGAYLAAFAEAAGFAREFSADCMYCNTIGAVWGMELAERLSLPSLWAVHESKTLAAWGKEVDDYFAAKIAYQLRRASHLLFVAESTRAVLSPWTSGAQTSVVPNGVDLPRIETLNRRWSRAAAREHIRVPPESSVITIVGTTTERKGQDVFIRAAERLLRLEPERDLRFFIVGAREIPFLEQLRRAIAASCKPEAFTLVPETPEVAAYFRASDCMVMCSREESAPLVSLECFAFERPLVSTAVHGLNEQLQNERNALLFQVDDDAELAGCLQRLLQDEELQARLVAAGRVSAAAASLQRSMESHWKHCCESYRSSFS